MSLIDLQRDMHAWLQHADATAADRLGGKRVAPGLRVHQNNFRAQLAGCLEESFARTRDWIGGEAFHRAVVAHVERVGPSSWTLDAYPRDFPATLALLHPADPEIAELAWIDLALGEAFVGPDSTALNPADLGDVDWDRAVLALAPTLELADLTTNAPAIWSALADGIEPPAVISLPETAAILVWREGEAPRFRATDQLERQALLHIRTGLSFAGLCDALAEMLGKEAGVARAGMMLGQWLADKLVVSVEISAGAEAPAG
ncbi:putative DNA-binding domain-containing protein [Sphingomonas psychrotolerans]|uniref:DNA-binding domain-containing protein n=1 Tax=Sphingomonas psychrotolerans TaxID=1327635 RepID=A0ABU3NAW1_9SPHN|nr:DNA-binding domain-containing protein [Sphingomonas psychrotolerans]MDT8760937.1 putative DNA-binding domain-containing protein [Sphingomonas psychrotolerans]